MSKKSDAPQQLIDWILKTENQFSSSGNYKVGAIRSDNDTEFKNSIIHEFCRKSGIEHQLTVPHTSFQNGAAERGIRSIEDRTRYLLIGGGVSPSLWTEAVSCAVYLINRLPIPSKKNMIAVCRWKNVSPSDLSINHL